jgi:uncharacterized membrane protein
MSDDGETIVGSSGYMSSQRAILWDEQHGMRRLQDLLIQEGVDLRGYTLTSANGISADGRVIVGSAQTTTGAREAFVAVIPEPNLAVTVGSVAALLLRRRTRRQQGAS